MGDRGYASVLALAMLFGGVLLIALAADVARLVGAWQQVSHAAHTAAEVGAGWVDREALYDGDLVVDPAAARSESERFLDSLDLAGDVDVDRDRVCVTVRTNVEPGLIRVVGASAHEVEVRACAEPRQG